MAILDSLRRFIAPAGSSDPHAPYLSHYEIVARDGEVYREADVPVVFFEDAPAMAKSMILTRSEPERGWRVARTNR